MQHTLIAVFDNRADADRAKDDLLLAGFKREDVRVSNSDPTGITDSVSGSSGTATGSTVSEADRRHEGFGASIKHFFADIFGTDNSEHAQRYSDAVSRGHHVLTVTTDAEPEVERAADIVERHGPVDIDEKHAEWAGGAPVAHPESMRMGGAGGLQQSAPRSQQSAPHLTEQYEHEPNLFAQQSLDDEAPMGNTYQEPLEDRIGTLQGSSLEGSALQGGTGGGSYQGGGSTGGAWQRDTSLSGSQQRDTGVAGTPARSGVRVYSRPSGPALERDDDYYRSHWNSKLGSSGRYEEYEPAYSYGSEMARSDQYRGRAWDDVEPDLRSAWDVRHPGDTSWERFKSAIREGWDRMTNDDASRAHWDSTYANAGGTYDEYAPAYSYGSEMARSDKYRGREWTDAESDLKSDWETRHPGAAGASTWERFKAAVRHGWDRMTS